MAKQFIGEFLTPHLPRITCAEDAFAEFERLLTEHVDTTFEHLFAMGVDAESRCLGFRLVASGGKSHFVTDTDAVFTAARALKARSFFVGHGQWAGWPSKFDRDLARILEAESERQGLAFLGHVVVQIETGKKGVCDWSEEEAERLVKMAEQGKTHSQAALELCRSRADVADQARKLVVRLGGAIWPATESPEAQAEIRAIIEKMRNLGIGQQGSQVPANLIKYAEATQSLKFPHAADYGKIMASYVESLRALRPLPEK